LGTSLLLYDSPDYSNSASWLLLILRPSLSSRPLRQFAITKTSEI